MAVRSSSRPVGRSASYSSGPPRGAGVLKSNSSRESWPICARRSPSASSRVEAAWSSEWERELAGWLRATRTGGLVQGWVEDEDAPARHARPEAWETEYSKFADATYEEAQAVWELYRWNLRTMIDDARRMEVPMILTTVVYNRFSSPRVSTPPDER